jgi:ABC-2 type transport system ATP-binding protein
MGVKDIYIRKFLMLLSDRGIIEIMKAISVKNLSKKYWFYEKEEGIAGSIKSFFKKNKTTVDAVREISFDMDYGEVVGFIGPNGAGKTTTLKMLSGILHPTEGHIEVMGCVPSRREKAFLKAITLISGQKNQLFWDLPAHDYFTFCKVMYEIPDDVYQKNLKNLVELAEIGDILKVPQRKLSFGQRKRCELAAALLHDPKVIFLDEPTNALDLINARKVREFVREKGREGRYTIILTSHNMSDIEQVCDRVIVINFGKVVFDGSIGDLHRKGGIGKQIRVIFNGPWKNDHVQKIGRIINISEQEILFEVDPIGVASAVSSLFANFSIKDIVINDPPLEKIIESIYLNR